MPILNVKIGARKTPEMSSTVATALSDLTTAILHKQASLIAVAIQYIDPEDWIIAGQSLAAHGKASFFLSIRITDETNTKAEKAAFVQAAYETMAEILGELHEDSYIHVEDVRATAYGFGGKTQEFRYHKPG